MPLLCRLTQSPFIMNETRLLLPYNTDQMIHIIQSGRKDMAKLKQYQDWAVFYTHAYRRPGHEDMTGHLDGLIESLDDYMKENNDKDQVKTDLLQSLKNFKQYSQYAAADINSGSTKAPNLKAAADEGKRIFEGLKKLEETDPSAYDDLQHKIGAFTENSRCLKASQWIEEAKEKLNEKDADPLEAAYYVLAARQLANAVKGKRANIDKYVITKEQLEERVEFLKHVPGIENMVRQMGPKKAKSLLSSGHGGEFEDEFRKFVQKDPSQIGKYAEKEEDPYIRRYTFTTAAEQIEEVQQGVINKDHIEEEDVAKVLAIRQIADAKRGKRNNIDNSRPDFENVTERSRKIIESKPFQDYMQKLEDEERAKFLEEEANSIAEENDLDPDDPKVKRAANTQLRKLESSGLLKYRLDKSKLLAGHGGQLEEDFANYLKTRPDYNELDRELYGRYMEPQKQAAAPSEARPAAKNGNEYKTYREYFVKNRDQKVDKADKLNHTAKLVAAGMLFDKDHDAKFDEARLNKKADDLMHNPIFRLALKDPDTFEKASRGDMVTLIQKSDQTMRRFSGEDYPMNEFFRHYKNLEKMQLGKGGEEMLRAASDVHADTHGDKITTIANNADLVGAIIDFQDANMGSKRSAQAVDESMKLLASVVRGKDSEVYLKEQINKVNKARGLKPGSRGYLKVNEILDNEIDHAYDNDGAEKEGPEEDAGEKDMLKNKGTEEEVFGRKVRIIKSEEPEQFFI